MGKLIQADLRVSPIAGSQFGQLHVLCVERVQGFLTLCGDDMCEDDVFTEQASDTKKFKFGYEECALSGTNAQCIIVRYNCVNNRCEEGISNVWYISNSVATGEVCEGGGVVIDP